MTRYTHQVSGIFQRHPDALVAFERLLAKGFSPEQMLIAPSLTHYPAPTKSAKSNHSLNNMLVFGLIGVGAGLLIALAVAWWLLAQHSPLLQANRLVVIIGLLGSGASVGATIGALLGSMKTASFLKASTPKHQMWFDQWIQRIVASPQMRLSVTTYSIEETAMVGEVLKPAVNHFQDERI